MSDRALITKKLGRYDIIRVLGKGAMGVVYEARDPNLNRKVAIKTVRVSSLTKEEAAEYELRFRTEAHSAARLQHPNIVSVYDSDRDGDTPFLVMEYVKGDDLKHYLDTGQRYTLEQSVRMMCDLLSALDYAHQRKIIHRDIKPANLLIEADGRVKLTDFGVARIQDSGEATRTQGGLVGTLKYMSPEQVEGKSVDALSDLFSAGIVLYQLLTDRRPFDGDSYFSIVTAINSEEPYAPSSINPMLPPAIDAVMTRALAKDKTQRFATAQEFSSALQAAARRADPTITPSANPYKVIEPRTTDAREPSVFTNSRSHSNITGGSGGTFGGNSVTQELELVYWKDVKDSSDREDLEGFIVRFPDGVYADLAKRRLKRLVDSTIQSDKSYDSTQVAPALKAPPDASEKFNITQPLHAIKTAPASMDLTFGLATFPGIAPASLASETPLRPAKPARSPDPIQAAPVLTTAPAPLIVPITPVDEETSRVTKTDVAPTLQAAFQQPAIAALPLTQPVKTLPLTEAEAEPATPTTTSPPAKQRKTRWMVGVVATLALVATAAWVGIGHKSTPDAAMTSKNAHDDALKAPTVLSNAPLKPVPTTTILTETSSTPDPLTTAALADKANAAAPNTSTAVKATPTTGMVTAAASTPASAIKAVTAKTTPKQAASAARSTTTVQRSVITPTLVTSSSHTPVAQQSSSISAPYKLPEPTRVTSNPTVANSAPVQHAPVAVAQGAPAHIPSGPREACEGKILFSYGSCLIDQCERSVYYNHAVCIERREQDARRKATDVNR
jgi:eukaryotic-like serine/threonine-protein kinase